MTRPHIFLTKINSIYFVRHLQYTYFKNHVQFFKTSVWFCALKLIWQCSRSIGIKNLVIHAVKEVANMIIVKVAMTNVAMINVANVNVEMTTVDKVTNVENGNCYTGITRWAPSNPIVYGFKQLYKLAKTLEFIRFQT